MNCSQWLIVLSAIKIVIHCATANQATSWPETKIVGGYAVKIRQVPFLLAFHSKRDGFLCGAVILSARWGMSALHCVKPNVPARNHFVRAGSSINIIGGSIHGVGKFYSFGSQYFDGETIPFHDIVLFSVKERFRFSSRVKPAKLPLDGIEPPELLRISGWGVTNISVEAIFAPINLRAANVTRVTWKECIAKTSWYESIVSKERHLCYGESEPDACYGDSGGPLANSDTVYGIVSFGHSCGVAPGVYTKVSHYRRWIKQITKL